MDFNSTYYNDVQKFKDMFDWSDNPSHLTLYPDVLKKKPIVEKQNLTKMPFVYYLQVYKSISDNSADWMSWQQDCQIMDL